LIGLLSVSGGDFSIVGDLCSSQSLAPAGTCLVTLKYTASAGGPASGTLTVPSNGVGSPATVALTGAGLAGTFAADRASVAFGSVLGGTTSSKLVRLTNAGSGPLSFSGISIVGFDRTLFSIGSAGTCTAATVLASGDVCSIEIRYAPTADGDATASLQVTGNATNSPFSIPLTGTASSPADLNVSIGVNTKVAKRDGDLVYTITVFNQGPSAAPGTAIVDALPSTEEFMKLVAPAGAACTKPAVGASGTLKCNVGTILSGGSVSITVTVKVTTRKTSVTNGASATSLAVDPDPTDNQASVTTPVK
jgi:uncharacterized repeat protein (TIGR01451 family)